MKKIEVLKEYLGNEEERFFNEYEVLNVNELKKKIHDNFCNHFENEEICFEVLNELGFQKQEGLLILPKSLQKIVKEKKFKLLDKLFNWEEIYTVIINEYLSEEFPDYIGEYKGYYIFSNK